MLRTWMETALSNSRFSPGILDYIVDTSHGERRTSRGFRPAAKSWDPPLHYLDLSEVYVIHGGALCGSTPRSHGTHTVALSAPTYSVAVSISTETVVRRAYPSHKNSVISSSIFYAKTERSNEVASSLNPGFHTPANTLSGQ